MSNYFIKIIPTKIKSNGNEIKIDFLNKGLPSGKTQ